MCLLQIRKYSLVLLWNLLISVLVLFQILYQTVVWARVFAYFMERRVTMTDEAIFEDTSLTIKRALQNTFKRSASKTDISSSAFEIALKQLV